MSEKYAGLTALQENVVKTKEHVESVRAVLDAQKANVFAYSTIPQNPTEGMIIMWVGADNQNMSKGGWYQYTEVTPSTEPKTYFWDEITASIDIDSILNPSSPNPVSNSGLTNVIQALQGNVVLMYASESNLPNEIDYSSGLIVSINTIAYCVSERTWYKVTAIDSSTLAITWSPYNPHIGGEVTEGDAIHVDDSDGSVNVVTDNTTTFISTTNYYAWKDSSDNLVFTKSATPNIGDTVYDETATAISDTIEAYDSSNATIDVNSVTYDRTSASDFHTTAVSGLAPDSEDFVVNGNTFGLSVDQRSYTGTRAGFNSLTPQQKSRVRILNITDEAGQGITVVNTVANNNMNPVTSNAVFNYAQARYTYGYYYNNKFYEDVAHTIEITGINGNFYLSLDTNVLYQYDGTSFVVIGLGLGETSTTAYRGDRGKTAYDHSQLTSGNPHNVTKSDVGLGNVDNTSDANKPISTATQTALDLKSPITDVPASITRSGTTFTVKNSDGTQLFTFTQQDNDTTTGDGIKTKVVKTGSGTTVTNTVAANTTMDNAIGTLLNNDYAIDNAKAPKSDAIKSITRNGTTFTATRCDDTTFTFTQQDNNTWTAMVGATSSANGSVGYVNAVPPKDGYNTKYLRADGTWTVPPNTTTGTTYTAGNVPANTTFATNGSVKNSYDGLNSSKQSKTLATALTLGGTRYTTVESVLSAIVTLLNKTAYWHQEA